MRNDLIIREDGSARVYLDENRPLEVTERLLIAAMTFYGVRNPEKHLSEIAEYTANAAERYGLNIAAGLAIFMYKDENGEYIQFYDDYEG